MLPLSINCRQQRTGTIGVRTKQIKASRGKGLDKNAAGIYSWSVGGKASSELQCGIKKQRA